MMCKAYGGEPTVDLFRGFLNLFTAGDWLTFAKRVKDTVVPHEYSELLSKANRLFFLFVEMAFRNFMFTADDDEMSFLSKEPSNDFGVVERMKDRRCRTRGSMKAPMKPWKGLLNNQSAEELLDLHDHYYARQVVFNNVVNRRARELMKVVNQVQGECEVIKEREKAREGKCKELEGQLRQDVAGKVKSELEMVSKVVSYISMKQVHSDEMDKLVGRLASSTIFYRRCAALEEVVKLKEPFDLKKMKGFWPTYDKEYTQARNDLPAIVFPFLSKATTDPLAPVKSFLSKKPKTLYPPTLLKTSVPSKLAGPSPATSKASALSQLKTLS
nr:hypothetical protein [Tanacetum cinerariifolium]